MRQAGKVVVVAGGSAGRCTGRKFCAGAGGGESGAGKTKTAQEP